MADLKLYQASWLFDDTTCGPFALFKTQTEEAAPIGIHHGLAKNAAERILPRGERHGKLRVRFVTEQDAAKWSRRFQAVNEDDLTLDLATHAELLGRGKGAGGALEDPGDS